MPHIILEYTANIKAPDSFRPLFFQIHQQVHAIAGVDIANCKSRARLAADFLVGEGATESSFIHLQVRFIEGRSVESKQRLGAELCELLRRSFIIDETSKDVQITVEIADIRLDEYTKFPAGTLTKQ